MQRTVSIDDGEYRFKLVFSPPSLYAIEIETWEAMRDRDREKKERNGVRCKQTQNRKTTVTMKRDGRKERKSKIYQEKSTLYE
jgi:hypothetical protein